MKRVELCEKGGGCVYVELDPNHPFLSIYCTGGRERCTKYMPGARFSGTDIYVPARLAKDWAVEALAKVAGGAKIAWLGLLAKIVCTGDECMVDDGKNSVHATRAKVVEWLEEIITEVSKIL